MRRDFEDKGRSGGKRKALVSTAAGWSPESRRQRRKPVAKPTRKKK